jgi:FAD:protein FMN transferase
MGCQMSALVASADVAAAEARLVAVERLIRSFEARLSRFRSDSELCRLNARAGHVTRVSRTTGRVLRLALRAARATGGLFDPTIIDELEAAGYDRDFKALAPEGDPVTWPAGPQADWRAIRLDRRGRIARLPVGLRLDLGGIAKGWAADRAAAFLSQLGPCVVDAGGDVVVRGSQPGQAGWTVAIASPIDLETDLALLCLRDRAVATSGQDYRRWWRGGQLQHHLIDPRTRRPARTDLLTVSVVAPNGAQADLLAKIVLLLGSRAGPRELARWPDCSALLVREDGHLLTTAGLAGELATALNAESLEVI